MYLKNNNINYKIKYEFDNYKDIIDYARKGYGIGIMPKMVANKSNLKIKLKL